MKFDRLLNALTQQEVAQLIDALLAVLSPELQEEAIAQLAEDTQQTVRQILVSDSAIEHNLASDTQTISLAKQAQTWSELWQTLGDTHSHWHEIYLHLIEQYAPDRYLDNLRKTIPQQWENGLPIIEALLAEQNYPESLAVIEETLHSLLISTRGKANWTPEATLLIATSGFYYEGQQTSAGQLLRDYQQTA